MNAGQIVLQRPRFDASSIAITLHSLAMLQKPRFVHAGICVADGVMITATIGGGVGFQRISPDIDVVIPFAWRDWERARKWLYSQLGKPYDVCAWALCAVEPFGDLFGIDHFPVTGHSFICSSIVGSALKYDDPSRPEFLGCRCCTPNDLGRYLLK